MQVRSVDADEFLKASTPMLLEDEARHNLMLGLAGTLRDQPGVYRERHLHLVESSGAVVAAGLRTPPFNLLVAGSDAEAVARLAETLAGAAVELPGVTGARPEADVFAARWAELTGATPHPRVQQRIYRLRRLVPPRPTTGAARQATEADSELLVSWVRAFAAETGHAQPATRDLAASTVRARLERGGFMLWEDGEPVSLAGWGGRTPSGIRIGPVYTPPEHRGHGYASAVTATASGAQLAAGRTLCFLYTDLANAIANRIYVDIGYEPVCDSVEYVFERPEVPT